MFSSLGVILMEILAFKRAKFPGGKSAYEPTHSLSILFFITQKEFNTSSSNSLGQLIMLWPFSIQS